VGNVDGAERLLTGYGVYYPPIARVAQADGAAVSQAGEGIAPSTIYQAVLSGHPVIAWISFDWLYHRVTHYVAFDGRTVQFGSPYEHAAVIRGVTNGYVLVNNPWFGVQWISKSTFESSYATFNDMAVIFGGNPVGPGMSTTSSTFQGPTPVPQDTYQPLTPARILDTRDGTGGVPRRPLGSGATLNLPVAGRGGVPSSGVDAVVLNVTVTNTSAPSFLSVFAARSSWPGTSNLNWLPGATLANLVTVPVGANGMVSLLNQNGQTDVVVDVQGWYGPSPSPTNAGLFNALAPARLLDTRSSGGAVGPGQIRTLQVTGRGGVPPAGVAAVALNLTATNATTGSHLSVFPGGSTPPGTSNLNFQPGQSLPNRVIVPVSSNGQVGIFNAAGRVDVVVDVNGWFTDGTSSAGGSRFAAITPQRILDTRAGFGRIADAGVATVQFTDTAAIGVTAIVANCTAVAAAAPTYLTLWPDGTSQPLASDLNVSTGQTIPNLVVAKLGPNGFDVYNAGGSVDLVIDLNGYYGPVGS
jgi:Peptidase_C39 like family